MTDLSNAIAERQEPAQRTARDLIQSMAPEFDKALPQHLPLDRFMRLALTELRNNPKLQECSAESILGALMLAAQLGLEPGGPLGQFYLTPRRLKGSWAVVPIIGYQGLRDLAYRSGLVDSIQTEIVHDGDAFRQGANSERGRWFEWEPVESDDARPIVGVVAIAKIRGAGYVWRFLTASQINARRQRGGAADSGPWSTDFEAMARKTALRDLAKDLPKSTELAVATTADETVQEVTA